MPNKVIKGNIFDVMRYARTAAGIRAMSREAHDWYIQAAKNISQEYKIKRKKNVMRGGDIPLESKNAKKYIGKMYMYFYDPKHKKTLPYYDQFPMVFIVNIYDDGFLGINMHYLPMQIRFKLFEAMLSTATNQNMDETTRLKINYQMLASLKKYRWAKPAFKRYLTRKIRSKMKLVPAEDWPIALALPLAKWKKASEEQVFNDSRKKFR